MADLKKGGRAKTYKKSTKNRMPQKDMIWYIQRWYKRNFVSKMASTYDLQRLKGFDLLGLGGLSNRNEFVF